MRNGVGARSPRWRFWLALMPVAAQARPRPPGYEVHGRRTASPTNGIWQTFSTAHWNLKPIPQTMGSCGAERRGGRDIPPAGGAGAEKDERRGRGGRRPAGKYHLRSPAPHYILSLFRLFRRRNTCRCSTMNVTRIVYTDGTPHPPPSIVDDSTAGRDTLVVDVTQFNDLTGSTWLGISTATRCVPNATPRTHHIRCEATMEDPKVFTRP